MQVEIDGVDLRDVDAAWFRARIGVVSQDPRLFSMTIRENIAYGLQQVLSCGYCASSLQLRVYMLSCRLLGRSGSRRMMRASGGSSIVMRFLLTDQQYIQCVTLGSVTVSAEAWQKSSSRVVRSSRHGLVERNATASFSDAICNHVQVPSQHDIEEAALAANAHGFICDLPMAYDTPVTDKCARRLSLDRDLASPLTLT